MTDSDGESVRHDDWPVEGHPYDDWDVLAASPTDEDAAQSVQDGDPTAGAEDTSPTGDGAASTADLVWIGLPEPQGPTGPILYSPGERTLYEGELDEEREAVRVHSTHEEDVEEASLGEHVRRIGDEQGWEWLSAFARDHLLREGEGRIVERTDSEFDQRNFLAQSPYDLGFGGSHTFLDESGRVHVIERQFQAFVDETRGTATVVLEEEYRVATGSDADRRAGDSELLEERQRELDVSIEEPDRLENELASELESWHEDNVAWGESTTEE